MPFDTDNLTIGLPTDTPLDRRNRRLIAGWLLLMCFMILVMIVLGGTTRLTGSGLSIMEWAPISGSIPPLSHAEWQRLFALYQKIPQYQLLHDGFGLAGFQRIFWLEWVHRLWGRLLGIAFAGPLLWFAATGRLGRALLPRLSLILLLGALQGAVGWFMVASGFFPDSTAVSPYRLVIHLALALLLYGTILWTALSVLQPVAPRLAGRGARVTRRLAGLTAILVGCTMLAGGFVAGLHAGLDYNSFPLMAGHLIPPGYAALTPFPRNLTENIAAVQFDHRLLASLTMLAALATVGCGLRYAPWRRAKLALTGLALAVLMQYALGVATLLWVVPVPLAAAHQAVAVLLLTAALVTLHMLRGAYRPSVPASQEMS
jgi:cytochrome c oxidase assembly protein subunit 15